ncbi:islet amyloid polypeptide [Etheostoma cragini]|uniref:islet amyloid polypeptide n=1 Tax=Etheostoma cragini TaxID=417921 RepID=UPI00155EC42E|nr:islet amyloid polypeptide [Etheostoma cragini]
MYLRVPVLLLTLFVLLRCVTAAPSYRYFSPSSSSEQESALPDRDGWLVPGLISNPFLSLMGTRPQRGLTAMDSHHMEKRKCNTATCVTQRLADFLVRSSNTVGTVYAPTNVGSATYGKRDLLPPPNYLPL